MADRAFDQRVADVRRFNRFYTRHIGLLQEGYLKSPFSLSEVRVLYELAHREQPTATELGRDLGLDAGYLSRILRGFAARGLVRKEISDTDGRQSLLSITERGRRSFAPVEAHTNDEAQAMLAGLSAPGQSRLCEAMRQIERALGAEPEPKVPYILRPARSGDMGWIVSRHGVLYGQDYGW